MKNITLKRHSVSPTDYDVIGSPQDWHIAIYLPWVECIKYDSSMGIEAVKFGTAYGKRLSEEAVGCIKFGFPNGGDDVKHLKGLESWLSEIVGEEISINAFIGSRFVGAKHSKFKPWKMRMANDRDIVSSIPPPCGGTNSILKWA